MSTPETYSEWQSFFLPEGEAHVERRQKLGDYISDPYQAVLTYASFAAFDALHKGPEFQKLDLERAYDMAARITGQPVAEQQREAA